jgi:hypothetical protein
MGDPDWNIFEDPTFNPMLEESSAPASDQAEGAGDSSGSAQSADASADDGEGGSGGNNDTSNGNNDTTSDDSDGNGGGNGGNADSGNQGGQSGGAGGNGSGSGGDSAGSDNSDSAADSETASNDEAASAEDDASDGQNESDGGDESTNGSNDDGGDEVVEVVEVDADLNGDGDVTVLEEKKAERKQVKKEDRKDDRKNNGGGGNNKNNNARGKNNNHRMGVAARFVAGRGGARTGDTASAGNGGRANASADGGIVVIGEINSGGNRGNTISVGNIGGGAFGECVAGPIYIDGGTVDNSTNIDIDAGGGTAIADASGGSDNLAAVSGNGREDDRVRAPIRSRYGLGARGGGGGFGGDTASAGNGGIAGSSADGGIVVIEEINSGGNQGNTIEVGDICAGPAPVYAPPAAPAPPAKPGKPGRVVKTPSAPPSRGGGGKVRVTRVPSTGVGQVPVAPVQHMPTFAAVLPAWRDEEDAGETR